MSKAEAQKQGEAVATVVAERRLATTGQPDEMMELLNKALDKDAGVETLERLVALKERVDDRLAVQAFNAALADFKAECPPIPRATEARIMKNGAFSHSYQYASLDDVAGVVDPILRKYGLTYTWDTKFADGQCFCTCKLRHNDGHLDTADFSCPVATRAGMSDQQKHGNALSHAKRQSLVQVLGLTTCDKGTDKDGADEDKISDDQVANLVALIEEVKAKEPLFLKFMGAKSLEDIPAADYARAVKTLEMKRHADS